MIVTIITSTYNCFEALKETADSIRAQGCNKFQWIIADGGSTDGTLDVIKANSDIVTHWFSGKDNGIYDAWNKATAQVKGEWVLFLGAGDMLVPNSLYHITPKLASLRDSTLLAYGDVILIDSQGQPIQYSREVNFRSWHEGRPVLPCHQGVFHHRSLFNCKEPFDSTFRICADAKLMLQAIANKRPIYLELEVSKMVIGGISSRTEGWLTMARENHRICKDLDLRMPLLQRLLLIRLYAKLLLAIVLGSHVGPFANLYRRITGRKPIY